MNHTLALCVAGISLAVSLVGQPQLSAGEAPQFVGAEKCKSCHLKQYNSWKATRMAKAYELLKPGVQAQAKIKAKQDPAKDYTRDPNCLSCHTTGYGKPGGFRNMEETPQLAGVQCEACHGPHSKVLDIMTIKNKEYKRSDVLKAGLVMPDEKTCQGQCHNSKSPFVPPDYAFDYQTNKRNGTHEHLPLKYQHE